MTWRLRLSPIDRSVIDNLCTLYSRYDPTGNLQKPCDESQFVLPTKSTNNEYLIAHSSPRSTSDESIYDFYFESLVEKEISPPINSFIEIERLMKEGRAKTCKTCLAFRTLINLITWGEKSWNLIKYLIAKIEEF